MPEFEIPTGPAITQRDLANNASREEARRAKRRATTPRRGSIAYDCGKGGMTLEWANEEEFRAWLAAKESVKSIELIVSQIEYSNGPDWRERRMLRCSREYSGGKSNYQKKTQWERKIPSKKSGCQCQLTVKLYPQMEIILGRHNNVHDHALGDDN